SISPGSSSDSLTSLHFIIGSSPQRKPRSHLLEVLVRSLIILCTALSVVLSSIAVCDGHWLHVSRGGILGLWSFCTMETAARDLIDQDQVTGTTGLKWGLGLCRFAVSLAVVAAIFSLELHVVSQVSEGRDASRRWVLGSVLVLVAAFMSVTGVVMFVALVWEYVSLMGFTLTFWCQLAAAFFFFLSGMAARHIHHMNVPAPPSGLLGKC
uniref:Transmembrane protein 37 n=1 Tax=Myripristis murdjan TaxID=586833 RepID=A0A668A4R6_9TELE